VDRRKIDRIELQSGISIDLAAWRFTETSPEQRPALADAWISRSEWIAAATAAADCSGIYIDPGAVADTSVDQFATDCWDTHLSDIDLIARIQRNELSLEEVENLYYQSSGQDTMAAVMEAEPGPMVRLDAPGGVSFSLAIRGPGWCFESSTSGSGSAGCTEPGAWQAPGVFSFSPGWGSGGWAEVQGLAAPEVARVILELADGTTVDVATFGHDADLGAVAYYHSYDWNEHGVAIAATALNGRGTAIASYDYRSDWCATDHGENFMAVEICGEG
jgi:hypothetical protein